MTQHVAVPLLEGAHSSAGALTLSGRLSIGGIECDLLLPSLRPDWAMTGERDLESPYDPDVVSGRSWPMTDWGFIHDHDSVTIQALGLILLQPLGWGSMLIDFDRAVGLWRHQLRDWLSVIADGPMVRAPSVGIWPQFGEAVCPRRVKFDARVVISGFVLRSRGTPGSPAVSKEGRTSDVRSIPRGG